MLVKPELFKGICFVRISSLPGDQKNKIRENYSRESIIKILKDNSIINDCIIYDDYVKWYNAFAEARNQNPTPAPKPIGLKEPALVKST